MRNVIMSMLAKISRMDAETKELTAQVEAQALLLSALFLTVSKNGGIEEMIASVNKTINTVLESTDDVLKTDAQLLLTHFQLLIETMKLIDQADADVEDSALMPPASDTIEHNS